MTSRQKQSKTRSDNARIRFLNAVRDHGYTMVGQYINSTEVVNLKCNKGHSVLVRPSVLTNGKYSCVVCNKIRKTEEKVTDFKHLAEKEGFTVKNWIGYSHKCTVVCKDGHEFKIDPLNFKRYPFCRTCIENGVNPTNVTLPVLNTPSVGDSEEDNEEEEKSEQESEVSKEMRTITLPELEPIIVEEKEGRKPPKPYLSPPRIMPPRSTSQPLPIEVIPVPELPPITFSDQIPLARRHKIDYPIIPGFSLAGYAQKNVMPIKCRFGHVQRVRIDVKPETVTCPRCKYNEHMSSRKELPGIAPLPYGLPPLPVDNPLPPVAPITFTIYREPVTYKEVASAIKQLLDHPAVQKLISETQIRN